MKVKASAALPVGGGIKAGMRDFTGLHIEGRVQADLDTSPVSKPAEFNSIGKTILIALKTCLKIGV
jgi:hypothetical protein